MREVVREEMRTGREELSREKRDRQPSTINREPCFGGKRNRQPLTGEVVGEVVREVVRDVCSEDSTYVIQNKKMWRSHRFQTNPTNI